MGKKGPLLHPGGAVVGNISVKIFIFISQIFFKNYFSWGAGLEQATAGNKQASRQGAGNKQATSRQHQARSRQGKQASRQAGKGENVEIPLFCAAGENFWGRRPILTDFLLILRLAPLRKSFVFRLYSSGVRVIVRVSV